ncbi:translesion error-prone DNA polymerase V autoproteolytic subunit [Hymenobacter sp. 5516J-16]|uniref:LexA family protein n=1 Tax=Hymenobacter sp. 5516J-16 TaxID=2932253 RepID=UPI001FD6131B|nr:translesion error-prone DNA polymerase V autoproteolytic subunit [Hymenobacter sp. 5516J-16]UOQ77398.1 translesion error-prone DNA polymerase V autoproteolytic subunit [Hymenobacter sp. 5516J-16]
MVPAGFPSPAEDHRGEKLDLNRLLLPHPDSTYLVRVMGDSMTGGESGIRDGALLAVDCQLRALSGDVVIAVVEGQFTVKRLVKRAGEAWFLVPDNPNYPERAITEPDLFDVWGVVTHVVTEIRRGRLSAHVRVS